MKKGYKLKAGYKLKEKPVGRSLEERREKAKKAKKLQLTRFA